jgi:hypothetical protein
MTAVVPKKQEQALLKFVTDFKIDLHFVDLWFPAAPGPTAWKVKFPRRGHRDFKSVKGSATLQSVANQTQIVDPAF